MREITGKDSRGVNEILGKTELSSWEVFAQYIQSGQTAVAMGPGASIANDSSFLTAAHLLGRTGTLLVVDPKSISRSEPVDHRIK